MSRHRGLRVSLFLGLVLLLSGCIKYDLMLQVNEDDTMDGTLIVAVAREFAVGEDVFGQSGDITPSQGSVTKQPYEDADYLGSRYVISGVPISEIDALSTDSSTRFSLTREGDEYRLDASLTFNVGGSEAVPNDNNFTAMVAITFPGAVLESNGVIEGNTVVWTQLRPSTENSLTARASALPNGAAGSSTDSGTPWWIWLLVGVGALLVAGIIAAVWLRRRRAAKATAAASAQPPWPGQQPGFYDEYGSWVGAPVAGQQSGYYDSGQEGGYGSYYGSDADPPGGPADYPSGAYGDTYGGPPSGGYSGQTVVGHPDTSEPPNGWTVRRPT